MSLKGKIQISGLTDTGSVRDHNEDSILVDGQPWQRSRRYRVTVNSFLAAGGDRFALFLEGTERVGGPLDVDALAQYLSQQSAGQPLAVDPARRIVRKGRADDDGSMR